MGNFIVVSSVCQTDKQVLSGAIPTIQHVDLPRRGDCTCVQSPVFAAAARPYLARRRSASEALLGSKFFWRHEQSRLNWYLQTCGRVNVRLERSRQFACDLGLAPSTLDDLFEALVTMRRARLTVDGWLLLAGPGEVQR